MSSYKFFYVPNPDAIYGAPVYVIRLGSIAQITILYTAPLYDSSLYREAHKM